MAVLPKRRTTGTGLMPYSIEKVEKILTAKIDALESRIKILEQGTKSTENEVAKVTPKKELTKAQLKDLCTEYGIDSSAFKNKQEFVDALKEKDIDLG